MRALIQRVESAGVEVAGRLVGRVGQGLLVYVGVRQGDAPTDAQRLAGKVANLRIFGDQQGKLNLSVKDIGGEVLVVPSFTLQADALRGRRPAFTAAAAPGDAQPLGEIFAEALSREGVAVARGVFGADMRITSVADGPVNIVLDIGPSGDGA